jgi:hypothetical protein
LIKAARRSSTRGSEPQAKFSPLTTVHPRRMARRSGSAPCGSARTGSIPQATTRGATGRGDDRLDHTVEVGQGLLGREEQDGDHRAHLSVREVVHPIRSERHRQRSYGTRRTSLPKKSRPAITSCAWGSPTLPPGRRGGRPVRGPRHRDISCQTRTLAAPGADATAVRTCSRRGASRGPARAMIFWRIRPCSAPVWEAEAHERVRQTPPHHRNDCRIQ